MNEYLGSERPFDTIPIDEVTPVVDQADRAIRTYEKATKYKLEMPNITGRMDWTSMSNEKFEFYDLTTGVTPRGSNFLQVGKQVRTFSPPNFTQTTFYLETDLGALMATHEDLGEMNSVEVADANSSKSDDVEDLMYELGEYRPHEGDWAEFQRIVALGEKHADEMLRLKKAEEQAEIDATNTAAREILERAFSEDLA